MLRVGTLAALSIGMLAACNGGVSAGTIEMRIVDADGHNPVDDIAEGTLTVNVRHQSELVDCGGNRCTAPIHDGEYQLDLPLASFAGLTDVQVELESADHSWIGALPPFQPGLEGIESTGTTRIVVGEPSSCHALTLDAPHSIELDVGRRDAAAVVRRNVAVIAGGVGADAASDGHVDVYDQVIVDRADLSTWEHPADIGRARGVAITEDVSIVVGDESAWRFVLATNGHVGPVPEEITGDLDPGIGPESALVRVDGGAAIIGGEARAEVQWLDRHGASIGTTDLASARTSPAAAVLAGGGVLVVGGNEPGDPVAEWVPNQANGSALDLLPLSARGGYLLPSPDGTAAVWIGFEEDGAPSSDVYVFRGCPDACTAELAGITWSRPRPDVAAVVTAAGALWLVGGTGDAGRDVDIVRWSGGAPIIQEGPDLEYARAGAVVFEQASGVVTVAGGLGDANLRTDIEMCFPARLDAL